MDILFLIALFILAGWLIWSFLYHSGWFHKKGTPQKGEFSNFTSPYEKMLNSQSSGCNIRFQRKQLLKRSKLLQETQEKGDQTSAKIHKSMSVFGKSVINHFIEKFKH